MSEDDYMSPGMALQQGWLLELECAVQHHSVAPCFWDETTISPDAEDSKWQHQIVGCEEHGPPGQHMDNSLDQERLDLTHPTPCCSHSRNELSEGAERVQKPERQILAASPPVHTRSILRPRWESRTSKFNSHCNTTQRTVTFAFEIAFWFPSEAQLSLPAPVLSTAPPLCTPGFSHTLAQTYEDELSRLPAVNDTRVSGSCSPGSDGNNLNWLQGGSCRPLANSNYCEAVPDSPNAAPGDHDTALPRQQDQLFPGRTEVNPRPQSQDRGYCLPSHSTVESASSRRPATAVEVCPSFDLHNGAIFEDSRAQHGSQFHAGGLPATEDNRSSRQVMQDITNVCEARKSSLSEPKGSQWLATHFDYDEECPTPYVAPKAHHPGLQRPLYLAGHFRVEQPLVETEEGRTPSPFTSFDAANGPITLAGEAEWQSDAYIAHALQVANLPGNPLARFLRHEIIDHPGPQVALTQDYGPTRKRAVVCDFRPLKGKLEVIDATSAASVLDLIQASYSIVDQHRAIDTVTGLSCTTLVNRLITPPDRILPPDVDLVLFQLWVDGVPTHSWRPFVLGSACSSDPK